MVSHNAWQSQGIILRIRSSMRRILVLDHRRGKIMCMPAHEHYASVTHGMLIHYALEQWNDIYFIDHIEPLALPEPWVSEDIMFLHHMLEMSAACLPYGHESETLFGLCALLYDARRVPENIPLFKTMFLCKILCILGMHPHEEVHDAGLIALISDTKTNLFEMSLDAEYEDKLGVWLSYALDSLSTGARLKTYSLSKRLGTALSITSALKSAACKSLC